MKKIVLGLLVASLALSSCTLFEGASGPSEQEPPPDPQPRRETGPLIELPTNQRFSYGRGLSERFTGEAPITDLGFTLQTIRGDAVVRTVDAALEDMISVGDIVIAINDDTVSADLTGYYRALLAISPGDLVYVTVERPDEVAELRYRAGGITLPADDAYLLRTFISRRSEGNGEPPVVGVVAEDARSAVIEATEGLGGGVYDEWRLRAMDSAARFAEAHFSEYEANVRLVDRATFNGVLADREISASDLFATERIPGIGESLPVDYVSVVRLEERFVGDSGFAMQTLYRRLIEVATGTVVASVEFSTESYEPEVRAARSPVDPKGTKATPAVEPPAKPDPPGGG